MRSNNKRSEILQAALQVVEESGANHLTIDRVAERAGFSKGGVLYHFKSKKDLLRGMLDNLIENSIQRIEARRTNGNSLEALLHEENQMTDAERRASLALVAAAAEAPELLEPARQYINQVLKQIASESKDPEQALILFLANEGLRFLNIFEINPMNSTQAKEVSKKLRQKAKET
ncbi:MAG: TetR/AcrR family transcriptional regulator [Pseudomonadales bacterium]|nr:TetR/AcrR family transcriptional regulator [Pseudomonadales bacterium]MBO6594901.1 TetR/AcrR family transcriptional regulator [Pseudomonadales bacterium]MBO6821539.1 TetR/AcrR family transcriptional regulator [Pseudomonadales bacterium]